MKKCFILSFVILLFSLAACKTDFVYDLEVRNDSSFDVQFQLNEYEEIYNLKSKEVMTISNTDATKIIKLVEHPRVDVNKTFRLCTFTDMEFYEVNVYNTLSLDITLTEDNGFIGKTYGETVLVKANSSKTFLLYTKKPQYKAFTKFGETEAVVDISNLIFY